MYYSDFHDFLKIYVSRGSVATQLKCSGLFNKRLIANFRQYVTVKKIAN